MVLRFRMPQPHDWQFKLVFQSSNSVQTDVTLGNNVQVTDLGKGIVGILTRHGESKFIHDIRIMSKV